MGQRVSSISQSRLLLQSCSSTTDGPESAYFYQVSFNSREYIDGTWSRFFDIRAYVRHGPFYAQELVVLQKADKQPSSSVSYPIIDLPIAVLDNPVIGSFLDEFHLDVKGWAFYPRRDTLPRLNICIDGKVIASCNADLPRSDVGGAFFAHENAQYPGFMKGIPIGDLELGEHLLWISVADHCVPLCATYFVVRLNSWIRTYNRGIRYATQTRHALRHFIAWIRLRVRLRTRLRKLILLLFAPLPEANRRQKKN